MKPKPEYGDLVKWRTDRRFLGIVISESMSGAHVQIQWAKSIYPNSPYLNDYRAWIPASDLIVLSKA